MSVTDTANASSLVVGYGEAKVLGPVDLTLRPGVTALMGRNGSGKTTLMRTLCGIIPALSGTCTVFGHTAADGAATKSQVGYLGHKSALANALTVKENLQFWAEITSTYPDTATIPTDELLTRFDLTDLLEQKVGSLSRGQRQRADLARLAMTDPTFVVLDEPLTGLDPVYAAQMRTLLSEWGESRTVLYSTHSVPEALELARHFLVVNGRHLIELNVDNETVTEKKILDVLEAHE